MFCGDCGKEAKKKSKYCVYCGGVLVEPPASQEEAAGKPPEPDEPAAAAPRAREA